MSAGAPARWVVILQRGSEDALVSAAGMAAAAVSLGVEVTLVWLDEALEALADGRLEESDAERGASSLLREARETGRLRHLACSASAVHSRAGIERVRERVDDVVGWPTVVSLIRAAERSFVW